MKVVLLICGLAVIAAGCNRENSSAPAVLNPYQDLPLKDTAGFIYSNPRHGNWSIAGKVYADRETPFSLEAGSGSGILVNRPDGPDTAALLTRFRAGDMDIAMEVMLPSGSRSAVYFMGRYALQLADSWRKPGDSLRYSDCGGICDSAAAGQVALGRPPALNACKAPGLWQDLKVEFRAPRFDAAGKKIRNACFKRVWLNGEPVQQDVWVSNPSPGAAFTSEAADGPLMIRGGAGPVAFRHIRYKSYLTDRVRLRGLELKVYKSTFINIDTLKGLNPESVLHPDSLSQLSYKRFEQGVYRGKMIIPATGEYVFGLQAGGPAWLWIDRSPVVNNDSSVEYVHARYGAKRLRKGTHDFLLIYNDRRRQLQLTCEGLHIPVTGLTTPSSAGAPEKPLEPYIIPVDRQAVVQRGFIMHKGKEQTHAIAVGLPGGLNYAYDLSGYNILELWRGGFIDAADMWRGRGKAQLEQPLGRVTGLSGKPLVQMLQQADAPWPDSIAVDAGVFSGRGYRLLKDGTPVFFYTYGNTDITDYIHADASGQGLQRELSFSFHGPQDTLYLLMAEARSLQRLPDGSYAVNNDYYIAHIQSGGPLLPERNGKRYRLLAPVVARNGKAAVRYDIIW